MEKQPFDENHACEELNPIQPIDSKTKNWTSYFKEFLMLFQAIVLGFFVENQRET